MPLADRNYQTLAVESSLSSPWQRQLIVLPTGCGKTITGLKLAQRMGCKTLWLAHREELITQPAKSLRLVWTDVTWGIVKAEKNEFMRQVVFASIQSAQQPKRTEQLQRQGFGLVVVDEAHHALSPGYRSLIDALGCSSAQGPRLLGLTATPERSDNGALDEVFQGIVFQMGITTAIEQGYLVPPNVAERPINIDLDSITVSRGDFGQKQLDIALMQAGIVSEITATFEQHCTNRKTLIFVVSVAQAEAVADALNSRGHKVSALSGETPTEQRRSILRKLASGDLSGVVNCMVLTEGFDEPSVDCVILARPTQSKPLMIQMVGRGLRLFPGKSDCLVIDMVGASKRNTMVQAAVLFGLKPDPQQQPTRATTFDPITDPEEYWRQRLLSQINGVKGAPRSKLRFLPAGDMPGWLLPAGEFGTVRMVPVDGDCWQVDAVGVRSGGASIQRLSDQPVDIETAQAIAEDYVRRVKAVTLASNSARWRDEPATDAQIAALKRAGIKAEGTTKGTAADLLTQVKAKSESEPATSEQIYFLRRSGVDIPHGISKREAMRMIGKVRLGR